MIPNDGKNVIHANEDNDLKFRNTIASTPKKDKDDMSESVEPKETLQYFTE